MWNLFWDAAWRVAIAGFVFGAGLPALFAVGVRSTVVARQSNGAGTDPQVVSSIPRPVNQVLGIVCFAAVLIAVVVGITIIVAAGLGKEVSFDHVYPTLVPKS
jgi:hypothetical protein